MKRLLLVLLSLLIAFSLTLATQNKNANKNGNATSGKSTNANRKPVFRATAEQIKQAQALLKQRTFYGGEQTGKLDADTRSGIKKYQQAEGVKVTGTLNKITLEKMGIALTDKQKTM